MGIMPFLCRAVTREVGSVDCCELTCRFARDWSASFSRVCKA